MSLPMRVSERTTATANGGGQASTPRYRAVNWIAEHFPDPEDQREYAREKCIEAVGSAIERAMENANLNRSTLAAKLGKSKSQVSRIMSGGHNMTIYTLGDFLWACNAELNDLELAPLGIINVSIDDENWQT